MCSVTNIGNQTWTTIDPRQTYQCQDNGYLDDPYEGELFTFFIQFFGGLSDEDIKQIWQAKAPLLVKKEYHMGNVGPITVQEGVMDFFNSINSLAHLAQGTGSPAMKHGRSWSCHTMTSTLSGEVR